MPTSFNSTSSFLIKLIKYMILITHVQDTIPASFPSFSFSLPFLSHVCALPSPFLVNILHIHPSAPHPSYSLHHFPLSNTRASPPVHPSHLFLFLPLLHQLLFSVQLPFHSLGSLVLLVLLARCLLPWYLHNEPQAAIVCELHKTLFVWCFNDAYLHSCTLGKQHHPRNLAIAIFTIKLSAVCDVFSMCTHISKVVGGQGEQERTETEGKLPKFYTKFRNKSKQR